MNCRQVALLGLLVAVAAAAVDCAHGRYVQHLVARRRHAAARWSAIQGAVGAVGFVLAVKVTLWMIPFELIGLYAGTWLAAGSWTREPRSGG